ncbi:MAG: endonuclease/exonuclease/phosphatase family protein [Desulfuromonadales bacterium]|nr:endonuclease/exonuclease/phosphatase family protein [Desulfuromonadales bacterium]
MTTVRIMTYNIRKATGTDGRQDPGRIAEVIAEAAPDIVALQDLDRDENRDQLTYLSSRLGMEAYGDLRCSSCAFLSYYPLKGVSAYGLGEGGCCTKADATLSGKRLHLFNVQLSADSVRRRFQVAGLLGPDLLGSCHLCCPTLILGDFADFWLGAGNMALNLELQRARRPWWNSTYPSRLPLFGRDRAYLRGDLRVLESVVSRTTLARQASSHLPMTYTLQVVDPRQYLHLKKLKRNGMEVAPG